MLGARRVIRSGLLGSPVCSRLRETSRLAAVRGRLQRPARGFRASVAALANYDMSDGRAAASKIVGSLSFKRPQILVLDDAAEAERLQVRH
jgi:hypothetical protein